MRWNMLNVIRVELILNIYKVYLVSFPGLTPLQSPRGQFAVLSLLITVLAHLSVQFNFSWFLNIYAIYLTVGVGTWLYKRVYYYHRSVDPIGVNLAIRQFDASKSASNHQISSGTLSKADLKAAAAANNGTSSSSASLVGANNQNGLGGSLDTNSLQRQRSVVYRDFQSVISRPRYNAREFALSLAHLSHVCKCLANEDVFDEMHFQILATRRDVYNVLLRSAMIATSTVLARFSGSMD